MPKISTQHTIAVIVGLCIMKIMTLDVNINKINPTYSDAWNSMLYWQNNPKMTGIMHIKKRIQIMDPYLQKNDTFQYTTRQHKYSDAKYAGQNASHASMLSNTSHTQINTFLPRMTQNKLIIIVLSARKDFKIRSVIRETWAKNHDNVFFVLGKPCFIPETYRNPYTCTVRNAYIQQTSSAWNDSVKEEDEMILQENDRFHDIIYADTIDVYRHLPQKLKAAYHWVVQNTNAEWILKIDVDCVVRVASLEKFLLTHFNAQKLSVIAASINLNSVVGRSGKWAEYSDFINTTYPPWPNGAGHVVSRPIAAYISENRNTLFNAQGEDVALGIWMHGAPFQKSINWVKSDKFIPHSGNCKDRNALVVGHQISPLAMKQCFHFMDETIDDTEYTDPRKVSMNVTSKVSGSIVGLVGLNNLSRSYAVGRLDGQMVEFMHITKTGGSLIEKAGAKHGIRWGACHFNHAMYKKMGCPGLPDLQGKISLTKFTGSVPWHVPFIFWEPNLLRHRTTFTVVRNPYDRAISEYYNVWGGYTGPSPNNPDRMNAWIQNMIRNPNGIKYLPQHRYVFDGDRKIVDYVIHFEKLVEEFNTLMMNFDLPVRLGKERFNSRRPGTHLNVNNLSRSTCRLIENFAGRDFQAFGYSFIRFNETIFNALE